MMPTRGASESNTDESLMRRALELAARGRGAVEPNPMVGCVIVRDGEILGQGYHHQFGGPHAEVDALQSLPSLADATGATAFVTLEPCCHQGKTPPCTETLISARLARVVVAMADPFSKVDGGGLRRLNDAGIETTVGVLREDAEMLNAPYLKRIRFGKPWVTAKWAMTMDGRIATTSGESQWITGDASRAEVHRLRGRVDAIAVGMGTVQADDPELTARPAGPRTAIRIVFCRQRIPSINSRLIQTIRSGPVLLVVGPQVSAEKRSSLLSAGVDIAETRTDDPTDMVLEALDEMGQRDLTNLMLEGGSELLASFFAADQIDECHVYLGAKAFGGANAPGPIGGGGVAEIADARRFRLVSLDRFDDDARAVYRKIID